MQDRYTGDVGDLGKLGMLRCMEVSGLKVGINRYFVRDESRKNDGKIGNESKDTAVPHGSFGY